MQYIFLNCMTSMSRNCLSQPMCVRCHHHVTLFLLDCPESIHSAIFLQYFLLRPFFQIDQINFSPQNSTHCLNNWKNKWNLQMSRWVNLNAHVQKNKCGVQTMISRSLVVTVRSENWHWNLTHSGHFHEYVCSCTHAVCSGHTPSLIERYCLMIVLSIREVCCTFLKVDIHFYFTFGAMNKWDHCFNHINVISTHLESV